MGKLHSKYFIKTSEYHSSHFKTFRQNYPHVAFSSINYNVNYNTTVTVSLSAVAHVCRLCVEFGGGSECADVGSGAATTVVGGWKVLLTRSISQFVSPAVSDAAMHLDRVIINFLSRK